MQILAIAALVIGLGISFFNWTTAFRSCPEKHVSPVPLLGGVLVTVGLLSFEVTQRFWWLGLIIDLGTFGLLVVLPFLAYQAWQHSDRNAAYKFTNTTDGRTANFTLFRNGDASIDISFDPPRAHGDRGDLAVRIGYSAKWSEAADGFDIFDYAGGRRIMIRLSSDDGYRVTETYPDGDDPTICALDGIIVAQEIGEQAT
ncbi:MAG: hypothetical protein KDB27_17815 [Planctomycetales bacterium]|nr:hypothetical protein [Planctomycetales bacterium]